MTQVEIEELMGLLAKFAHENGRENLEPLRTIKSMVANAYLTATPSSNDEMNCRAFDTGRFNEITYAYMLLACKQVGLDDETGKKMLGAMHGLYDEIGAEQALHKAGLR